MASTSIKPKEQAKPAVKDKDYIKRLEEYIARMRNSGYSIESIRRQLVKHGHFSRTVEETVRRIRVTGKSSGASEAGGIAGERSIDSSGNEIAFEEAGGTAHESSGRQVSGKQSLMQRERKKLLLAKERLFIFLYFLGLVFFIFWLSKENQVQLSKVFLCFLPAVASMIAVIIVLETQLQHIRVINWVIPLLAALAFYIIATTSGSAYLAGVDVPNIAVANFIVSIILVIGIESMISAQGRAPHGKARLHYTSEEGSEVEETVTRNSTESSSSGYTEGEDMSFSRDTKQFEEYIQSIEDKCKAINFVIGRVYSNKHGGSPKLRESIRFNPDWYNTFSKIESGSIMKNIVMLKKVLWSIYDRLLLLGKHEADVFTKADISRLKGLARDEKGSDQIITVLSNNDKDPVMTYYQSAHEFCRKATEELRGLGDYQGLR